MKAFPISCYDRVTLRPLNILGALHDPDFIIQIVPTHEADAVRGRISVEAPLGRAVLRRFCGDQVTIRVQDHQASMRILAVEKPPPPDSESSAISHGP